MESSAKCPEDLRMFLSRNELCGDLEEGLMRNIVLDWLLTAGDELAMPADCRRPEGLVMVDSFSESLSCSAAAAGLRKGAPPGRLCQ